MMSNLLINPKQIAKSLSERGAMLNGEASRDDIDHILKLIPGVHDDFISIFKIFNGFEIGQSDPNSAISIWDLSRIIRQATSENSLERGLFAIGDFMVGSEDLVCNPIVLTDPVFLHESSTIMSKTFYSFWQDLCDGKFDF